MSESQQLRVPVAGRGASIAAGVAVLLLLYLSSLYSYLLFHTLVEFFTVSVAVGIFIVAWNSRRLLKNNYLLFIGIASGFVALLDLVHTLTYKNMAIFQGIDANVPTQLWIAARYLQALSFLAAPLFFRRKLNAHLMMATYTAVITLVLASIFYWRIFPDCLIEGSGLTPFKKGSEYVISLLFALSLAFLVHNRKRLDRTILSLMVPSIIFLIIGEVAFTFYVSVFGLSNLVGHFAKGIAFFLIYKAFAESALTRPYEVLFRELHESEQRYRSLYDNNLDPIFSLGPEGRFVSANAAAERLSGYSLEELRSTHFLSLCTAEMRDEAADAFRESLCRQCRDLESAILTKDNVRRDLFITGAPVIVDGQTIGVSCIARDITEKKKAEMALRDSERQVRNRLEAILSPEGDIGALDLADIIDAPAVQALMDYFYGLTHVTMAIIDLHGKVLVGVGWQDLCTKFHRVNPDSCRNCIESDTILSAGVPAGEFKLYRCKNNLWDVATPLVVGGRHVGNVFMGQFFFDDEPIDYNLFRSQAATYGFDETSYIAALDSVPRLNRTTLETGMAFFLSLANILSQSSYSNLKLARSIAERDSLMESLRQSERMLEQKVATRTAELAQTVSRLEDEVAQRQEAEAVLRKNDALFQTVLRTIPAAVIITGADGGILFKNPAAATLLEIDFTSEVVDHYIGLRAWRADTGEALSRTDWGGVRALLNGKTSIGEILTIETRNGNRKTVTNSSAPIRDEDGTISGSVTVFEDITTQQDLQKQLLHAQKLDSIGALAGGVAHDFNNILMAICGFTEEVCQDTENPEHREILQQVLTAGDRARELTQKLLTFSRQQVTETKVINLSDTVAGVNKFISRIIGEDIEISRNFSQVPLYIRGNLAQIEQALMNIILNARDAMPNGGTLSLATGTIDCSKKPVKGLMPSLYGYVSIEDSGTGIPEKIVERIFEPYFTTKDIGKGTGLGLAIAYGIARQHGGTITVSTTEGKGARFTMHFPLTEDKAERHPVYGAQDFPGGTETLLVVEDDRVVREYVKRILVQAGYQVVVAENGSQALEVAHERHIDIVFSDVLMPKMNGFEMYLELRKTYPHLKVVFASGYSSDVVSSKGIDPAHVTFLQKPVFKATLLRTLRDVLDEQHPAPAE